MLYTWSSLYKEQLDEGDEFTQLKPAVSIWLLTGTLFPDSKAVHHHFQAWDRSNQVLLNDQLSIHVLELEKWQHPSTLQAEDEWLYFFKEAKNWKQLPKDLNTPEMRQAMSVLEGFSEQEESYHLYQSRLDYDRDQRTRKSQLRDALASRDQAIAREERLLQKLRDAGIEP